jgi:hypothetical protein
VPVRYRAGEKAMQSTRLTDALASTWRTETEHERKDRCGVRAAGREQRAEVGTDGRTADSQSSSSVLMAGGRPSTSTRPIQQHRLCTGRLVRRCSSGLRGAGGAGEDGERSRGRRAEASGRLCAHKRRAEIGCGKRKGRAD